MAMVSFGSQVDFSLPHIKIRGLNKFYQSQGQKLHALKEINLDIPQGKILGIIGKSGAGTPHFKWLRTSKYWQHSYSSTKYC